MKLIKATVLALALAAGGCSALDYKSLGGKETLMSAHGHRNGYDERVSDAHAAEVLDRVVLITSRFSETGRVVAYEERMKGGVILWDTRGKRIGSRYVDLRSRGTNAHNGGLTIVFVPRDSERLAQKQHIAQVTIDDIKQHLGLN